MSADRPLSGPVSVTLAGLTILALAVASFAAKLNHELNLPRAVSGAQVVIVEPKEPPQPPDLLALAEPPAPPPKPRRRARPRVESAPQAPPPELPVLPSLPTPAWQAGIDAAAVPPAPSVEEAPPAAPP